MASDNIRRMYPVILELGPVRIYSFGLMMALGFLAATYLTGKEFERRGYNGEIASSLVLWAAIGGLVGARLWNLVDDWNGFLADPIGAVFTGAGFTWYGGFLGGFVMVTIGLRRHGIPWAVGADSIAPGMVLGHAIGRIGCQLAGDGDWGAVTTVPWGMAYPKAIVGWDYPPGVVVHPTPLYEAAAYTAIFAFLWSIRRYDFPRGTLIALFLVLSPLARFLVEFVRINTRVLGPLTEAQLMSLVLVLLGAAQLFRTRHEIANALRA